MTQQHWPALTPLRCPSSDFGKGVPASGLRPSCPTLAAKESQLIRPGASVGKHPLDAWHEYIGAGVVFSWDGDVVVPIGVAQTWFLYVVVTVLPQRPPPTRTTKSWLVRIGSVAQ